jgi:hypothetical protein
MNPRARIDDGRGVNVHAFRKLRPRLKVCPGRCVEPQRA